MKRPDAVYSREELSPDGSLHICYNYMEGEKSATVIEPCVTVVATGEIIVDFWRTRLNGHLDNFTSEGFRLTVSDNLCRTSILVLVDVASKTFTFINDSTGPRLLSVLGETLFWTLDGVRNGVGTLSGTDGANRPSIIARILQRLR